MSGSRAIHTPEAKLQHLRRGAAVLSHVAGAPVSCHTGEAAVGADGSRHQPSAEPALGAAIHVRGAVRRPSAEPSCTVHGDALRVAKRRPWPSRRPDIVVLSILLPGEHERTTQ